MYIGKYIVYNGLYGGGCNYKNIVYSGITKEYKTKNIALYYANYYAEKNGYIHGRNGIVVYCTVLQSK